MNDAGDSQNPESEHTANKPRQSSRIAEKVQSQSQSQGQSHGRARKR